MGAMLMSTELIQVMELCLPSWSGMLSEHLRNIMVGFTGVGISKQSLMQKHNKHKGRNKTSVKTWSKPQLFYLALTLTKIRN